MKRSELFFSFLLLPVDAIAVIVAFLAAYTLRVRLDLIPSNTDVQLSQYLRYGIYLLPAWLLFFAFAGLYNIDRQKSYPNKLYKIFLSSSAAILLLIVFIFLNKISFFSRLILIYTWVLSVSFVFLGRVIIEEIRKYLFRYNIGVLKVVCIGANEITEKIISMSNRETGLGIKVIGVLSGEKKESNFKILGRVSELCQIIKKYKPDEIILTDMSLPEPEINAIILACSDNNVTFKFIPNVLFLMTAHVNTRHFAGLPMMEVTGTPLDGWGRIAKRVGDIIFALFGLVLSSPFALLSIIMVPLTSRGPVLYSHERIGRDGKKFKLYKFRSMYFEKCDFSGGTQWTKVNDPRITPYGRFIRKTNIDEIPQFINVLKGDMSMVGPRPEQPSFVEKFQKEIPEYFKRHRVKSGLTGWAQVNGLKGDTSIRERVNYDIFYIENWNMWLDIKIVLLTIILIIKELFGGKYEYRNNS
jgi:exopolysaccharide biosynthesis polyprenyl glycosylphosphotransferase